MTLTLRIENETSLPDGGPLSVTITGKRGLDIGRDQYLDWTLPDPTRFISAKHCEVRWHDGGYWLHDISTNGTFLDGADSRLKEPHRLRHGDRFAIGRYIVAVELDDEDSHLGADAAPARAIPSYGQLWDAVDDAPPPIDPRLLKAPRDVSPVKPDFLDWAIDVPSVFAEPSFPRADRKPSSASAAPAALESWSQSAPKRQPPAPDPIPLPTPRRPTWVSSEPQGPWAPESSAVEPQSGEAKRMTSTDEAPRDTPTQQRRAAATHPDSARQTPSPGTPPADPADGRPVSDFVRLVAQGAGLPYESLAARDPAELAEEIGMVLRLVTENMKQLLEARQHAKRLVRSSNHTTIQAIHNNPMKFAPTVEDAMRIMFGPQTRSYLDARRALAEGFDDLKSHQLTTYTAMQQAVTMLLAPLDPEAIEDTSQGDRGLMSVVGSRKARLWDIYASRWEASIKRHEDGGLNAYMQYFAECYDRNREP
jgi:type VI secretion system protein ImpI